jgi:hypothetical protein
MIHFCMSSSGVNVAPRRMNTSSAKTFEKMGHIAPAWNGREHAQLQNYCIQRDVTIAALQQFSTPDKPVERAHSSARKPHVP